MAKLGSALRALSAPLLALLVVVMAASFAAAQAPAQQPAPKSPFGIAPPSAPAPAAVPTGPVGRTIAWVQAKQGEYNRALVAAVRRLKTDNVVTAAATLAFLSFLYGVFHAVGPGHGKAVISAYVLANERTARRGVLIAFIASAFQALTAIALVGIMAVAFRATSLQMQTMDAWIERASYALIVAVGAWLLVTQLRALVTGKPAHGHGPGHHGHGHADEAHHKHAPVVRVAGAHAPAGHAHAHAGHSHGHDHAHAHGHGHAPGDACDEHCGHAHLPEPAQLEGAWSWRRALALSFAVGIRPCTGAVLVLVFALTQGLFWAGVFATFAMALGTFITVAALAVLAVTSRDLAARLADGRGAVWVDRVHTVATLGGSGLVLLLGLALLAGSFGPARPF